MRLFLGLKVSGRCFMIQEWFKELRELLETSQGWGVGMGNKSADWVLNKGRWGREARGNDIVSGAPSGVHFFSVGLVTFETGC